MWPGDDVERVIAKDSEGPHPDAVGCSERDLALKGQVDRNTSCIEGESCDATDVDAAVGHAGPFTEPGPVDENRSSPLDGALPARDGEREDENGEAGNGESYEKARSHYLTGWCTHNAAVLATITFALASCDGW